MDRPSRLLSSSEQIQPVSPDELYQVMLGASSQDPAILKQSSERLKQMISMLGALDALQTIAAQPQVPKAVRTQSAIQLKNAIPGTWRSRKALKDEHRNNIRARVFEFTEEEDDTIALCNEEVAAKLARMDYPTRWPNLIPELMQRIDATLQLRYSNQTSEDPQVTRRLKRLLRLLKVILAELVSVKMLHGVQTMGAIVRDFGALLWGYYKTISALFMFPPDVSALTEPRYGQDILFAHLTFKAIFKLANWLWMRMERQGREFFDQNKPWFDEVVATTMNNVQILVDLRFKSMMALHQPGAISPTAKSSLDMLTRHIRLLGKFFRALQRFSAAKFTKLPSCDDLVLYYWGQVVQAADASPDMTYDSNEAAFPVRFLVQAMVLFKDSLSQWTPVKKIDNTPNSQALSPDFVEKAVGLLVTRFMPLNPKDLDSWMSDPEEWVNMEDQENDQWEFQLRPCSERVLITLANQHQEYVTPLLKTTFSRVFDPANNQAAVDLPGVIEREALYCALGRCCHKLKGEIPFEDWLGRIFAVEARSQNKLYPIIKRRIAWVIGKWVGESCSSPNNPLVWEILVGLLQSRGDGSDEVVRLTAAVSLKDCINVIDFEPAVFEPHLPVVVTELMRLMGESEAWESKRKLSEALNVTIERVGSRITSLTSVITAPLPKFWTEAADNWMFKSSLLTTVTTLLHAIKTESSGLSDLLVPLIQDSLSPVSMKHLDDYVLTLWSAALRNTTTVQRFNSAACLLDLAPIAVNLLATNLDLLGKIISIVDSYLILDSVSLIQACGINLFMAAKNVLAAKSAPEINQKQLTRTIHALIQVAPSSSWGEFMHFSELFGTILHIVRENEAGTLFLLEQIHVLARTALVDAPMFLKLMQGACEQTPALSELQVWDGLLDHWIGKFDNMSEPQYRKLTAMSLAALAATGRVDVLKRLPAEVYNLWLDVLYEIKEMAEERPGSPGPLFIRNWETEDPPHDFFDGSEETAEYERRRRMWDNDPVRTIKFTAFLDARLRDAEASVGFAVFQAECIAKTDQSLIEQITKELRRK